MPSLPILPSTLIALALALLYTSASQAHFTARFAPDLAGDIDIMTANSHQALEKVIGLDYLTVGVPTHRTCVVLPKLSDRSQTKYAFGAFDFMTAVLLWRSQTRTAGLTATIMVELVGLYGQLQAGGELGQLGTMVAVAVLGMMLRGYGL